MRQKKKIFENSFVFLTLMLNFVFIMRRTRQVCVFIKYLLNLESKEEFYVILHKAAPGRAFDDIRGRNVFKPREIN